MIFKVSAVTSVGLRFIVSVCAVSWKYMHIEIMCLIVFALCEFNFFCARVCMYTCVSVLCVC